MDALGELDAGLDDTRAARVIAMANEATAPTHLVAVLGAVPTSPAGRQVWCALAYRVESYRDRHPAALGHDLDGGLMAAIGPRPVERWQHDPEWAGLAGHLRRAPALVALATGLEVPGGEAGLGELSCWLERLERSWPSTRVRYLPCAEPA